MKDLANHKAKDIHRSKPKLLKWVANDLFESITKLSNLVAKEGFSVSWTNNFIQIIFKFSERHSLGKCRTVVLETIGKLHGFILEKIISRWEKLKGLRAIKQARF